MSAFKKLSEEENVASVLSFFFLFLPHLASSVFFMNVLLPLLFFSKPLHMWQLTFQF